MQATGKEPLQIGSAYSWWFWNEVDESCHAIRPNWKRTVDLMSTYDADDKSKQSEYTES